MGQLGQGVATVAAFVSHSEEMLGSKFVGGRGKAPPRMPRHPTQVKNKVLRGGRGGGEGGGREQGLIRGPAHHPMWGGGGRGAGGRGQTGREGGAGRVRAGVRKQTWRPPYRLRIRPNMAGRRLEANVAAHRTG